MRKMRRAKKRKNGNGDLEEEGGVGGSRRAEEDQEHTSGTSPRESIVYEMGKLTIEYHPVLKDSRF